MTFCDLPLQISIVPERDNIDIPIDIGAGCAKLASNSMRQHEGSADEEAATI